MGRDEAIKTGPRSHIDDTLALAQRSKQQWVCYPSERSHRCVRQCVNDSRIIAKARCTWPARTEVKGSMRIGRYLSVFFPDLLPEGFRPRLHYRS
jgi:hypothetical protein